MTSKNNLSHSIESLNELVGSLIEGDRVAYNQIMHSIKIPIVAFAEVNSWSEECYTRNCIAQNDKFELILICWEKGQVSPIHDHGGEECWVKIIEGEFRETLYKKNEKGEFKSVKSIHSAIGDVTYMVDFMGYHRLENLSNKRSMSLHLYARPIKRCSVYDEESKIFVMKDLSYDTVTKLNTINDND